MEELSLDEILKLAKRSNNWKNRELYNGCEGVYDTSEYYEGVIGSASVRVTRHSKTTLGHDLNSVKPGGFSIKVTIDGIIVGSYHTNNIDGYYKYEGSTTNPISSVYDQIKDKVEREEQAELERTIREQTRKQKDAVRTARKMFEDNTL